MNEAERLEYLVNKRKWLQEKGMDLRQSRLIELKGLLTNSVDAKLRQYVPSNGNKPV